uniref:Uncharacterized protein n=1 Tax=Tetraselmis sp. GSL018 TaxID=582737 RepID=A0A061QXP9_9CHLO
MANLSQENIEVLLARSARLSVREIIITSNAVRPNSTVYEIKAGFPTYEKAMSFRGTMTHFRSIPDEGSRELAKNSVDLIEGPNVMLDIDFKRLDNYPVMINAPEPDDNRMLIIGVSVGVSSGVVLICVAYVCVRRRRRREARKLQKVRPSDS